MRRGASSRDNGAMTPIDEDGAGPAGAQAQDRSGQSEAEALADDRRAWSDDQPLPPDQRLVGLFWEDARTRVGLSDLDVYLGENPVAAVPPPAWQFGDSARIATELVDLVLAGRKTATAGPLWEYEEEDEPLPEVGALGIVCDGAGIPRALVRTDAVDVVPFDQVSEEHAAAEGEGNLSLDFWRRVHVRFLRGHAGRPVEEAWPEDTPWPQDRMVLERLTCLWPKSPRRRDFGAVSS